MRVERETNLKFKGRVWGIGGYWWNYEERKKKLALIKTKKIDETREVVLIKTKAVTHFK